MRKNYFIFILFIFIIILTINVYGKRVNAENSFPEDRKIQTYGQAELKAQPDLAKISLAIETRSKTADHAVAENSVIANRVKKVLLDTGIYENNIKTGSYRLYSFRETNREQSATNENPIFYQVTNEMIITTSEIDTIGEIIDLAVASGANSVNYINFELADPQDLMLLALQKATQQAFQKAKAIAESISEEITVLANLREENTNYLPFRFQDSVMQREISLASAPTPIEPDEISIRASVIAEFYLKDLIREPHFVLESTKVNHLFKEMQHNNIHMAFVIDEYGGTDGIVTIEDVIEEIVGNIFDEYDEPYVKEPGIFKIDEDTYLMDGTTNLYDVENVIGRDLPTVEYDTLSGFVINLLGYIPIGEEKPTVEYNDIVFMVTKTSEKRIIQVKVEIKEKVNVGEEE